jgi:hypothetical protein
MSISMCGSGGTGGGEAWLDRGMVDAVGAALSAALVAILVAVLGVVLDDVLVAVRPAGEAARFGVAFPSFPRMLAKRS